MGYIRLSPAAYIVLNIAVNKLTMLDTGLKLIWISEC